MSPRVELPPPEPATITPKVQIPVKDGKQDVARSAKSGRFVSPGEAKSNPDTTVTERIDTKPAKKKAAKKSSGTKPCPSCKQKPGLKPGTDTELCPNCNGSGRVKA